MNYQATPERIPEIMAGIQLGLKELHTPPVTASRAELVAEEICVNIIKYAYGNEPGYLDIDLENGPKDTLTIHFTDKGKPFNPLEIDKPDVDLSLEDRTIGGLGIFLTKEIADSCSYTRQGDANVLTVTLSRRQT